MADHEPLTPPRAASDRPAVERHGAPDVEDPCPWLPVWHTRDRKTRVLFWSLVAVSAFLALVIYVAIAGGIVGRGVVYVNSTFLFWGWSRFVHEIVPASLIYNPHALYAFEYGLIGTHAQGLPFAYPPSLLLLIWPLGLLRPAAAFLVWLGVSTALYCWACWRRPWGSLIALTVLVAPSTLATLYYGQASLLVAALIIGGFRLVERRPIVAGVLFGLATIKPQFGLLVPVALISARQWRAVLAAATTVALTVIASGIAFGRATWERLPPALTGLSKLVMVDQRFARLCPTITASLRLLGVGPTLAYALQFAVAACTAVVIWVCFRRGVTVLGTAVLMVGAFFMTPYALFYDLPLATYAVLAFVIERHQSREPFSTGEMLSLILIMALPVLIAFNPLQEAWGVLALALFFFMILRRIAVTSHLAAGHVA